MTCKEFNNQLALLQQPGEVPREMEVHMSNCVSCMEAFEKTKLLFDFVAEEKAKKISPFVTTRIMAQIESAEKPGKVMVRPVLAYVLSLVVLLMGFFSASLFTSSEPSSLADTSEVIATDYFFSDNPGSQLEDIWLNTYSYE
jgi:hypothetical protein